MKNKQLYIAYGSNINLQQMAYRCPHSRVAGTSEIKDFELEFRGVATIVPKKGASVPVLILMTATAGSVCILHCSRERLPGKLTLTFPVKLLYARSWCR